MLTDRIFGSNEWAIWFETGPGDAEVYKRNFKTEQEALSYAEKNKLKVDKGSDIYGACSSAVRAGHS